MAEQPCRQGLPLGCVTVVNCGLYRSFHPYLGQGQGGLVSVALPPGSRPVAVNDCHFPLLPGLSSYYIASKRLADGLATSIIPVRAQRSTFVHFLHKS